ncbi:hypothetical protein, partial [Synechococcus sp. OH20]|uniref:hypothetical protein n=1 Tax=Synechococcus sp. OH20 TaxID=139337 RepID=UPI0039C72B0B
PPPAPRGRRTDLAQRAGVRAAQGGGGGRGVGVGVGVGVAVGVGVGAGVAVGVGVGVGSIRDGLEEEEEQAAKSREARKMGWPSGKLRLDISDLQQWGYQKLSSS